MPGDESARHDVVREEQRVLESDRLEDELVDCLLVRLARDLLDDPAGEGERRVVVRDDVSRRRDLRQLGHVLDVAGKGVVPFAGIGEVVT